MERPKVLDTQERAHSLIAKRKHEILERCRWKTRKPANLWEPVFIYCI